MVPFLVRARRRLHPPRPAIVAVALLALAAKSGAAQPAPVPPPATRAPQANRKPVSLVERPGEMVWLVAQPLNGGSIGLVVSSQGANCRVPEAAFELPIQINDTGFQLKHAIRPEQKREGDGSCTETIATSYHPQHYWPLKTAKAVTLHLPWGPLPLTEAALAHLRGITPARPAEDLPAGGDQYATAINRLNGMLAAGQARPARQAAEALLPAFATRPPDQGFAFFAMLGMARRMTGDLALAASCFEVAAMLSAKTDATPTVGIVYDNLATVRRLQKRWAEAEQANDRAIATLEPVDEPQARQALAGVYNNRATLLAEQEKYEPALAYSEKALAILTVVLGKRPKELEPFLADNRKIREKLGRP